MLKKVQKGENMHLPAPLLEGIIYIGRERSPTIQAHICKTVSSLLDELSFPPNTIAMLPLRPLLNHLPRLPQTLQIHQLGILPPNLQQLPMRPMLHHPALIKYIDHIRLLDRAQAMRHRDRRASLRRRVQGCLHHFFRLAIEGGCGFVKEEYFRVAQKGAGDGDALLLAA